MKSDDDDDEILMSTLAHLEDLLLDSVDIGYGGDDDGGEEVWNSASSKEGETLRQELKEFESRILEAFLLDPDEGKEGKEAIEPGEFTLEQEEMHRQFAGLVEARVEAFLGRQGSSALDLVQAIKRADERGAASWNSFAARDIVELLKEVDDFALWAKNMQQKAKAFTGVPVRRAK